MCAVVPHRRAGGRPATDERLPALISAPYEDEEDLVFDPARHQIELLTYFYKDSQDPSRKEVCKCKHMNQL